MRSSSAAVSIAVHLLAVLIMSFVGARVARERDLPKIRIYVPLSHPRLAPERGGGGSGQPLPSSKGQLPPPPATRVFVPPVVTVAQPKLPVSAALIDAPEVRILASNYGDPLGAVGPLSAGPGDGGGHGPGHGPGTGPGSGPRYGGDKVAPPPPVSGAIRYSKPPELVYKVEPEYPDEARKARYQGVVVLRVEVDATGRTTHITVLRGLGLGLDENAVRAVQQWRFKPAIDRGKPVPAPIVVEVSFRLL